MASEPSTETATATKIKLEPPEALQPIAAQEASGLVPLKSEETSELDQKVAKFVDELAALDSNSPEFGKKVDAADRDGPQGNRRGGRRVEPLPRPAGQGDRQRHRHRRRPDRASPHGRGSRPQGKQQVADDAQVPGDHSLRPPHQQLFRQVPQLADAHLGDPVAPRQRQGRAADGQCRDRHRARRPVEDDASARADDPHLARASTSSSRTRPTISTRPSRPRPRRSARPRYSIRASAPPTC